MVTKIIVTVSKIRATIEGVKKIIGFINDVRDRIRSIRDKEIDQCWCGTTNADSNIFKQRMQELQDDINRMLDILEEYAKVLAASAEDWERTQNQVKAGADALTSPGRR